MFHFICVEGLNLATGRGADMLLNSAEVQVAAGKFWFDNPEKAGAQNKSASPLQFVEL